MNAPSCAGSRFEKALADRAVPHMSQTQFWTPIWGQCSEPIDTVNRIRSRPTWPDAFAAASELHDCLRVLSATACQMALHTGSTLSGVYGFSPRPKRCATRRVFRSVWRPASVLYLNLGNNRISRAYNRIDGPTAAGPCIVFPRGSGADVTTICSDLARMHEFFRGPNRLLSHGVWADSVDADDCTGASQRLRQSLVKSLPITSSLGRARKSE